MDKSCACATPVRIATYLRAIRPGGAEWPPCGLEFLTIRTVAIPGSTRANRHFETNKGNLSDHIAEIERKIKGATASIISETGNKEFKGIKKQALFEMVDAIIIPIMTYACEGWTIGKEENKKLQTIFNEVIKTLLYLPKGIPTMILLNETGYMPVEYTIMRKKIMQAKRIDMMKEEAPIKDATQPETSTWRKHIEDIAKELNVYEQMTILSKEALKTQIIKEIESKIQVELENEAEQKNKGRPLETMEKRNKNWSKTKIHG